MGRWRKAEGYLSAIRLHENKDEYQPWKNFTWADFVTRNKLRRTYYNRHAKYSDGKDHGCFGGLVTVPSTWEEARNKKVLPARKKRRMKKSVATPAKASPAKRIYNLETGEFEEVKSVE